MKKSSMSEQEAVALAQRNEELQRMAQHDPAWQRAMQKPYRMFGLKERHQVASYCSSFEALYIACLYWCRGYHVKIVRTGTRLSEAVMDELKAVEEARK